jgi:hypothetical protein
MDEPQINTVPLTGLLDALRGLIRQGRHQALRAVDMVQVQTCWEIGRHIVEFEQGGEARAAYGKKLLPRLSDALAHEFGKGFDERNLRHMRAFYQAFPIWDAVRTELSWTHYRTLLRVSDAKARHWYVKEAAEQNWSARALDRQIGTMYFERLLLMKLHLNPTCLTKDKSPPLRRCCDLFRGQERSAARCFTVTAQALGGSGTSRALKASSSPERAALATPCRLHGGDGNRHGQDLRLPAHGVRAEPALRLHQVRHRGAVGGHQGRRLQDAADHPRALRGPVPRRAKGYEFFQYDSTSWARCATSPPARTSRSWSSRWAPSTSSVKERGRRV